MNALEIQGPEDGSILIADRDVTFTAAVDRAERANEVVWTLASRPGLPMKVGASFSMRPAATGVEQVIASIDGLTAGVIVYVFKTPGGTGTVADLMQSEPPASMRSVASFTRYPKRALRAVS